MFDVHALPVPTSAAPCVEPLWVSGEFLQPPAVPPLSDAQWQRCRDAVVHHECRPGRAAMVWLRSLPESLQPVHLLRSHARVANLLCHRWDDRELALRFLKELLNDSRGGRNGFPPEVADELRALADHLQWQAVRTH